MYFIDVQGTLIDDIKKEPIEGSIEFIDYLNKNSIPYIIITNNTKVKSSDFYNFLLSKGFNIKKECYIDPFYILNDFIDSKEIAPFGTDDFKNILKDFGYSLNYKNPNYVIISINKDYTNDDFALMIELILKGAKLIGMHETSIYAKDKKRYPGVGAILKMLSFATNRDYKVVGKPSIEFYSKAKNIIKAKDFNQITIISDDLKGDIVGAKKLGMKGVFVLSGKIKDPKEIIPTLDKNDKPDFIYKTIGDYYKEVLSKK